MASTDASASAAAAAAAADAALRPQMSLVIAANGGAATKEGWSSLWHNNLMLWDLQQPTPLVQDEVARALADGRLALSAAVFVPGCGVAHDVLALAERGFRRVVGADIVDAAVEAARANLGAHANAEILCADFFSDTRLEEGSFDLIVDYTFFCAISPAQRAAWGARTAALLRPGGRLLTLLFPLAPDDLAADPAATGPPHPVSLAQYRLTLEPHGVTLDAGEPRASGFSVPQRAKAEMVGWWTKCIE